MEYIIRKSKEKDKFGVARLILKTFEPFKSFLSLEFIAEAILKHGFNENDLVMIIDKNVVGYHSLVESNIYESELEDELLFDFYKNKKGLNGLVFCIHPNYQNKGLGSKFIQFEREYFKGKYDYIWGGANDKLNNFHFWKKNRDFIKESSSFNKYKTGLTSIQNI